MSCVRSRMSAHDCGRRGTRTGAHGQGHARVRVRPGACAPRASPATGKQLQRCRRTTIARSRMPASAAGGSDSLRHGCLSSPAHARRPPRTFCEDSTERVRPCDSVFFSVSVPLLLASSRRLPATWYSAADCLAATRARPGVSRERGRGQGVRHGEGAPREKGQGRRGGAERAQ